MTKLKDWDHMTPVRRIKWFKRLRLCKRFNLVVDRAITPTRPFWLSGYSRAVEKVEC